MKALTGILVLGLALVVCSREPQPAVGEGQLLAAGLPHTIASADADGQDPSSIVVRRLWFTPALEFWGSPSPDGRYLTYVDRTTGDVALHDFRMGENRRVTSEGSFSGDAQQAVLSTFSPDGEQIAYGWIRKGCDELRVVGVDGSKPRVLYRDDAADANPVEWSKDGNQILVGIAHHDGTKQLGLVSVDDGSLRVLKTFPKPASWTQSAISPDGRFVIYDWPATEEGEERDVFVLGTDGSGERVLIDHPADDRVAGWAPDGEHILFGSDRTGTMGVWLLPVEDGRPAGEPKLVKPDLWRARPLGFDAKGSYYYGLQSGTSDVHVAAIDLETGRLIESPAPVTNRFTGVNQDPAWSPDGRYLAYLSNRSAVGGRVGNSVLVIRAVDSGEKRELQPQLFQPSRLEWSPDGLSFLVQAAEAYNQKMGLYRVDAQTGDAERLVLWPEDGGVFASWGRSGSELVLFSLFAGDAGIEDERSRISVLDLETGEERILAERDVYWPAVSHDRQQVVFTRVTDESSGELVVVPVAGGEPRILFRFDTEGPRWPLNPAWGPDGRHIYYVLRGTSDDDAARGLWRVPVAGGEPEKVEWATEEYLKGSGTRSPVQFHPDGHRIALVLRQEGAEVWVMEDFLPSVATGQSESEKE